MTALAGLVGAPAGDLRRMVGGASRETWAFEAELEGASTPLILRRDPPGRPSEAGTMALEARVMIAAGDAGLRVPAVVAVDDGSVLGTAGIVMRHVHGETLARRIQRDDTYATARRALVRQCGGFLAGLHAIDPSAIDGLPDVDPLEHYRSRLRGLGRTNPTYELALRWLDANRPPAAPPAIVHGDFRLGNLIVDEHGLAAVIDWELAHLGDPLEDLAWLCTKAWRFRQPSPVAGLGDLATLFDAYTSAGGAAVDPDAFRWWSVFTALKWGVICEWQSEAHLSGAQRSVELAAIGRRSAEQEWDLLELLDPDACRAALAEAEAGDYDRAGQDDPGVYGRPTATELLEATREYVTDEVMPTTREHPLLQFHGRVAANVVSIVERQLRLGPSQADRHRRLFAELGVDGVDQLAAGVEAGAWDERLAELYRALAAIARDKLAVAEPRHLTIPSATGDVP